VVKILDQVIANMAAMPAGSEVDVNNVTLRLSLDITGGALLASYLLPPILQELYGLNLPPVLGQGAMATWLKRLHRADGFKPCACGSCLTLAGCAAKTGIVGFAKDFGTTMSFSDSNTDEIFILVQNGAAFLLLPDAHCYLLVRGCHNMVRCKMHSTPCQEGRCCIKLMRVSRLAPRSPRAKGAGAACKLTCVYRFCSSAALRELHCRAINPLRRAMFWDAGVRGAPAMFASFRARMMHLLKEVRRRKTLKTPATPLHALTLFLRMGCPASVMCVHAPQAPERPTAWKPGRSLSTDWHVSSRLLY
jgi:hypothetical protein